MYAIIEDSGTQIKVSEGDVIKIDTRDLPEDQASLTFDRVLMVGDSEDAGATKIGAPHVDGAKVTADIIKEGRTKSVPVVKFKRRKNYTRRKSHRQGFVQVKVTKIQA